MSIITNEEREYLLNSMEQLLAKYDYDYTRSALNTIIDKWATQKKELIEAFKKHPHYLEGQFMIAFDYDYERILDKLGITAFSEWLQYKVIPYYVRTLPDAVDNKRRYDGCSYLPSRLYDILVNLEDFCDDRTISEGFYNILHNELPEVRIHPGEKTSRVINKICSYLHYDQHSDYNREFAKFADSLSPMVVKRHTLLSLNPLDYLTMSFGNSWSSCHTIDKRNLRGMPNGYEGQYSCGTMSYMLDGSSMVFYTVDADYDGIEYWDQPKIHRQMYHWGEDKLVQGRLYPQDKEKDPIIDQYRAIVQEIMSSIFDFPNLWSIHRGCYEASRFIVTHGLHYPDYDRYESCTLSIVKDVDNAGLFIIGSEPICIKCGKMHLNRDNINHCY